MSLAGICWNMMAFSVFPKKSDFRKIKITEKICLAYQMPPKVLVLRYEKNGNRMINLTNCI